jgi:hypothetical protein
VRLERIAEAHPVSHVQEHFFDVHKRMTKS